MKGELTMQKSAGVFSIPWLQPVRWCTMMHSAAPRASSADEQTAFIDQLVWERVWWTFCAGRTAQALYGLDRPSSDSRFSWKEQDRDPPTSVQFWKTVWAELGNDE